MLGLGKDDGPRPKCYYAETTLPNYVDDTQPPTKKRPFSTVRGQPYSHTLDIIVPQSTSQRLQERLANPANKLQYARFHMKPIDLVQGDFFNHYIKSGNVILLSEGRLGIDSTFSFSDGILRIEVDKPTYERMGLQGKATPGDGRKHLRSRYVIELNLRLPSMVDGKKGFQRVIWAFKNALDFSLAWLFYDLNSPTDGSGPLASQQPSIKFVDPIVEQLPNTIVPGLRELANDSPESIETLEWLTMVLNSSPRISQDDEVDPYLCRYRPFEAASEPSKPQDLVKLRWHGLIPSAFITKVLIATLKATSENWFAISAVGFTGQGYAILKIHEKIMIWEGID